MSTALGINGETRLYGILGHPVASSLSPAMHNAAFAALGINGAYVPFPTHPEQLKTAVKGLTQAGVAGFNLTVPHKQTILPLLDEITPLAQTIGAVNTVRVDDGRLSGTNTDGDGLLRGLKEDLDWSPEGQRVLLLGAGGAARGIAFALLAAGVARLDIANRTAATALSLASDCAGQYPEESPVISGLAMDQIIQAQPGEGYSLVINSTSVGMGDGKSPIDLAGLQVRGSVADIVYTPLETPLLKQAKELGIPITNGLGMLLHQGWLAFQFWTGMEPPLEVMRNALMEGLAARGK